MATENSNLPAPEEQVGNADDVLSTALPLPKSRSPE